MLKDARLDGRGVVLSWVDGRRVQVMTLSLPWLRDHAPGPETHHPTTGQRVVETIGIPPELHALGASVAIEDGGRVLRVEWTGDGTVSRFDGAFLAGLRHDPEALPVARRPWRRDTLAAPSVPYDGFMGDDETLRNFLEAVARDGFCSVEGVPGAADATRVVCLRIAYMRATVFGEGYWEYTTAGEGMSVAFSTRGLSLHTDGSYSADPPGYQLFHCLATADSGGENLLVDGLAVAETLRREHPRDFEVLCSVPIPYQYVDRGRGIHVMASRPVFRLDEAGGVAQVCYSNYNRAPFVVSIELQHAFYRALATFGALCADPRLHYRRLLSPGSVLLFDNWRVLHAREPFIGGHRRMGGCYFNKEDVDGRLRSLRARADRFH